jgi:hypothetical protein
MTSTSHAMAGPAFSLTLTRRKPPLAWSLSGVQVQGSLGDALDYSQAEAGTGMVTADAFGAALERFGERRDQLRAEILAGVLDNEHDGPGTDGGLDLHGAVFREVVDDRVVQEVRGQLQQQGVGADGGGMSPETSMVTPCFSARGGAFQRLLRR